MEKFFVNGVEVQIEDVKDNDGLCTHYGFFLNGKNYRSKIDKHKFNREHAIACIRMTLIDLGFKDY